MAESAALASVFRQPFAEQVAFFRAKLNLPTERWDDIWQAAHDRAFIVAGAAKADLLADLRAAVDKGIHDGTTLAEFRRDFRAIVARHGWTGWTGEGTKAGVAWRTRTIFETNLRTSYAAGRYRQLTDPELLALRPFWRYVHSDLVKTPRPHHKGWGDSGLTLRHDHPFWQTHFPPNGWGCRCTVTAVRETGKGDATEPPEGWDVVVEKTGAPPGIDRGWAYAPGANAQTALLDLVGQKLFKLDAAIGSQMWLTLAPVIQAEQQRALAALVDTVAATMLQRGDAALVTVVKPDVVARLARLERPLESADVWLRDVELVHALRDTKAERGAALPASVWRDLPRLLETATPYFDTADPALIYVFDAGDGLGKVVVRINYHAQMRTAGKRVKLKTNFVRTGGFVDAADLTAPRYKQLTID